MPLLLPAGLNHLDEPGHETIASMQVAWSMDALVLLISQLGAERENWEM
jgi:hypothetical protein